MGLLGDLSRFVIADVRVQSGDKHQGILNIACNGLPIDFDPDDEMIGERTAGIREQATEWRKLWMMTGLKTFNSKLP